MNTNEIRNSWSNYVMFFFLLHRFFFQTAFNKFPIDIFDLVFDDSSP